MGSERRKKAREGLELAKNPEAGGAGDPQDNAETGTRPRRADRSAADTEPSDDRPDRRDFLARAGSLLVGAGCLGALAGSVRVAVPSFRPGPARRFALGSAAEFKPNTLTWLRERDLFVLRTENGYGALSARCTHLGCIVRRSADGFVCPCHGARFDPQGRVTAGPARRALPWYRLWRNPDGRLWVATDLERPAGVQTSLELEHRGRDEGEP